jgi:hypothetical protein
MGAEEVGVQPDAANPLGDEPRVLPRRHAPSLTASADKQGFARFLASNSYVAPRLLPIAPAPRYQDPVLQPYGLSPYLREEGRRPLRGEGQRRVGAFALIVQPGRPFSCGRAGVRGASASRAFVSSFLDLAQGDRSRTQI